MRTKENPENFYISVFTEDMLPISQSGGQTAQPSWPLSNAHRGRRRAFGGYYKYPHEYCEIISKMQNNNEDIISALAGRPFLAEIGVKIFSKLDLRSVQNCKKVSRSWRNVAEQMPLSIQREADWIDPSFTPRSLALTNPRDLTQSWDVVSPFDNGNLNNLKIDDYNRMIVASGRQIWIFDDKGVLQQYMVLKTTDAMFVHTTEKHAIVFDAISTMLIYDISTGKLVKSISYIPPEYAMRTAEGEIYEIPRCCYAKNDTYYLMTTRQVITWEMRPNLKMVSKQIYVHDNRRSNLHGVCVEENAIFLSVGGYHFGANDGIVFEGVVIPKKKSYIRQLTLAGVVVKDIGKDPDLQHASVVRQIARKNNFLFTLSFDDTIKVWNLTTGRLVRTVSMENLSCSSKIILTENMLIWSVWGKLQFYDLEKMVTDQPEIKLRTVQFRHDVSDFAYDHDRIVLCSKRLHIVCNLEHYDT